MRMTPNTLILSQIAGFQCIIRTSHSVIRVNLFTLVVVLTITGKTVSPAMGLNLALVACLRGSAILLN